VEAKAFLYVIVHILLYKPAATMDGIAGNLIDHLLKPGSSLTLIPIINISLLGLFGVLLYIAYQTDIDKIHVLVMGTLGVGLLLSVNW
jgi:hypothetical protein